MICVYMPSELFLTLIFSVLFNIIDQTRNSLVMFTYSGETARNLVPAIVVMLIFLADWDPFAAAGVLFLIPWVSTQIHLLV